MIVKIIVSIFFIFLIAFSIQYFDILEPKNTHENIEKDFYTSLNLLKNSKEDLGLVLLLHISLHSSTRFTKAFHFLTLKQAYKIIA
jgi:hypothetical protein